MAALDTAHATAGSALAIQAGVVQRALHHAPATKVAASRANAWQVLASASKASLAHPAQTASARTAAMVTAHVTLAPACVRADGLDISVRCWFSFLVVLVPSVSEVAQPKSRQIWYHQMQPTKGHTVQPALSSKWRIS